MTLEQIAMMAVAAKTLKEGGAYSLDFPVLTDPSIHLPADRFTSAVASTHVVPAVFMHTYSKVYWQASLSIHGVTFYSLYLPDQLPLIGYHLVDGRPVPINEEVR